MTIQPARVGTLGILAVGLVLGLAEVAGAQCAVDQRAEPVTGTIVTVVGGRDHLAQTFTVGQSGQLCRLSLFLQREVDDVVVELRPVLANGEPDPDDAHLLFSRRVPQSALPPPPTGGWVDVDVSPGLAVTAGQRLAVVARPFSGICPGVPCISWASPAGNPYSGGRSWLRNPPPGSPWLTGPQTSLGDSDFAFRAWVDGATASCPPAFAWSGVHIGAPRPGGWAMASDTRRGRVVLFGSPTNGTAAETWEWDGTTWTRPATAGPPARFGHALAYDARRGVTVLFGGQTSALSLLSDTWEWDGASWRQAQASASPPPRAFHALAYDLRRGVTVLYGGAATGAAFDDTWEWDGANWRQIALQGPGGGGRHSHALAYDYVRGAVVLFGGGRIFAVFLDDTWTYDGTAWTQLPASGPIARFGASLAYDLTRDVTVLFGGQNAVPGSDLTSTWELSGSTWRQTTPPRLGNGHPMAFDLARRQSVLLDDFFLGETAVYPATSATSVFCVAGPATGQPWSWCVNGPGFSTCEANVAGAPAGAPAAFLAKGFVDSINQQACPGLAASLPGFGQQCFSVSASTPTPFELCVGPGGGPADCCVTSGQLCTFNPELEKVIDESSQPPATPAEPLGPLCSRADACFTWEDFAALEPSICADTDANRNAVPDRCEPDCDRNGKPDDVDRREGAGDCDEDGVLDRCESNCNCDAIPDDCQAQDDDDDDGRPDLCEPCEPTPSANALDPRQAVADKFCCKILRIDGDPSNIVAELPDGTILDPVEVGQDLPQGTIIATGEGETVLCGVNGTQNGKPLQTNCFQIGPGSEVTIDTLALQGGSVLSRVAMTQGEVRIKVTEDRQDFSTDMKVATPNAVTSVTGTEFEVALAGPALDEIRMIDGSGLVRPAAASVATQVCAGGTAQVFADGRLETSGDVADLDGDGVADACEHRTRCTAGPTVLCLNGGRFQVVASWRTPQGQLGLGEAVQLTDDTGYFWFFSPTNVETIVKVLDACTPFGHHWVFAAGLTNVEVDLVVKDTLTGAERLYHNPQGQAFRPVQDTAAFRTCTAALAAPASEGSGLGEALVEISAAELAAILARPAHAAVRLTSESTSVPASEPAAVPAASRGAACTPDATTLCLNGGRFEVRLDWQTPQGGTGAGSAVPLTQDTGYFWFFDRANVEVVLKVLDACSAFGRFWVFSSGLTNVGVRIAVTDSATGTRRVYENAVGQPFQPLQDTGAFACP